ncbi:hypothetical protein CRENBAI_003969, partial [Crenichthys baileyi]
MMLLTWVYTSSCNTSTPRDLRQDPVCRLQLGLQHHHTRHPPPEAHPAQKSSLHLSGINSFLTDRQQQDGDESAYRQEGDRMIHWCSQNCLELNPIKTVEM